MQSTNITLCIEKSSIKFEKLELNSGRRWLEWMGRKNEDFTDGGNGRNFQNEIIADL